MYNIRIIIMKSMIIAIFSTALATIGNAETFSEFGAGATGGDNAPAVAPFELKCDVDFVQRALELEKHESVSYTFTEKNYAISTFPGARGYAISVTPFGGAATSQQYQVLIELNGETQDGRYSGIESTVATSPDTNSVHTEVRLKTESEFSDVLRRRTLSLTCNLKSPAASVPSR